MKPIVLFGGTFDPVHNGHIAIAQAAAETFAPEKIIVLPAGNPYQRQRLPFATAHHRVAMLLKAMGSVKAKVVIDKRELNRTGPTYTFDTLRELRIELGEKIPLIWLIGSDAFAKLDTWRDWPYLFEMAHFAVFMRQGDPPLADVASAALQAAIQHRMVDHLYTKQSYCAPAGNIVLLNVVPPDVSSTQIRAMRQHGHTIRGLLPSTVCDYIEEHKLYSTPS